MLFHSPKRNIFSYLSDINLLLNCNFLNAPYSLMLLKVLLDSNQSSAAFA